jgi:hypothetical protein
MPEPILPIERHDPALDAQKDRLLTLLGYDPATVQHTIVVIQTTADDLTLVGCQYHTPLVLAGALRKLGYYVIAPSGPSRRGAT